MWWQSNLTALGRKLQPYPQAVHARQIKHCLLKDRLAPDYSPCVFTGRKKKSVPTKQKLAAKHNTGGYGCFQYHVV